MAAVPVNFPFSPGGSIELPSGQSRAGSEVSVSIESAEDKITFAGNFVITRDLKGLALAQAMLSVLQGSVQVLMADLASGRLPDALPIESPTERDNPFA